jgi:hypothetical protein
MTTNNLTGIEVTELSLVGKGAVARDYILAKSIDEDLQKEESNMDIIDKSEKVEKKDAPGGEIEKCTPEEDKKKKDASVTKAKKDPAVDEEDAAEGEEPATNEKGKKLPPWLQKQEEEVKKEAETLRKEMEDLKKMVEERDVKLAKMEDERMTKVFIEKAQEYPYAGKAEEFGLILKEVSQKTPTAYAALEKTLGAMTAQIKEGNLFKELGKSSGPAPTSVIGKVTELAKGKVVPGKVTLEKAIDIVLRENPDLYNEYRKE